MGMNNILEKFHWKNQEQYFATIIVNLIVLSDGCLSGWVSPAISKLMSSSTPLSHGPLTVDEISWIGAIASGGSIVGTLLFGYLASVFGSKKVLSFLCVPHLVSWLLIYFGSTYHHILISRIVVGLAGGGLQTTLLLYITDIARDEIRGQLGSLCLFFKNLGVLIAFALGAWVDYQYIPGICAIIPLIFIAAFTFMPNTPRYYLERRQTQIAQDALKYYKGYRGRSIEEEKAFYTEFDRLTMIMSEPKVLDKFRLLNFCNRKAMYGLGIGIALLLCSSFTAISMLSSYACITFQKVGTTIDPNVCSIAIPVALMFGALTTAELADKLGRRVLCLVSLMGAALGLLSTALYLYLGLHGYDLSPFSWVPVMSLSFVIFIASAGILPLSHICGVENLPSNVRTGGLAIICFLDNIWGLLCSKSYPILLDEINLHNCLAIFGIGSIVGFIFVFFVLKETSGQSLDDASVNETKQNESV